MERHKKPSFPNILRTNTFWCHLLSVYLLHLLQQSQLLTDLSIRILLMPSLRASAGLFPHTCSKSRTPSPDPATISPCCAVSGYAADPRTQTCDLSTGWLSLSRESWAVNTCVEQPSTTDLWGLENTYPRFLAPLKCILYCRVDLWLSRAVTCSITMFISFLPYSVLISTLLLGLPVITSLAKKMRRHVWKGTPMVCLSNCL